MKNRQAFTLTELLITMSAGSTLMILTVGLVHQSMHLTTAARGRADEHRPISKLANQFRHDVHWADEVIVEPAETVRMLIRSVGEVTYDRQASECVRLAAGEPATGDQLARPHRERFLLEPGGTVLFAMLEQPSRAVLTVFRGEASGKQAILNLSSGDMPARPRPPAPRVEAVIGRLAQITEAQAEEETNVSQQDRGDKSLSEKGSDPLEASRFHYVFGLAGKGQTPFRIGSHCMHFPARVASDARRGGEGRDAGIGHHRRGVVLICALVCLAVATAIVLTTIRQALDARRHGRMERQLRQTEYLLDAGIRRAVAGLRGSDDYSGETWRPVGALPRMESVLVEIHVSRPVDNPSSHQVTILAPRTDDEAGSLHVGGFDSMHPGGANFAIADGSVRFLTQRIDPDLFRQLGNRADGELMTKQW